MARDHVTLQDLTDWATRVGVKVIVAPSSHRGQLGKMGTIVGITRHHTGTPNSTKSASDYPDYQVVKEGRAGLVNSLSAYGLGRHESIFVFSEYLSWHAGEWLYDGIKDGNGHFLGIEAAGIGDWTDWQRDVYPRLCASVLLGIGEGPDMMPRHADGAMPRGRKTDMGNEWPTFRAEVANYLAHPELIPVGSTPAPAPTVQEDDDMRFIQAPARGFALIGPGYIKKIDNDEERTRAQALYGNFLQMSDREWDVSVALCLNGQLSGPIVGQIAAGLAAHS